MILVPTESDIIIHHQMDSPNLYPENILWGGLTLPPHEFDDYFFSINSAESWSELIDKLGTIENWDEIWKAELKNLIDFDKNMLICAIDDGSFDTHSIDITDIIEGDNSIEVRVKGLFRLASADAKQHLHIVRIPKTEKIIDFKMQYFMSAGN